MNDKKKYWLSFLKKIIYISLCILGIYVGLQMAIFYLPFVIAFLLALIFEPIIKFIMKKIKISRKISAILVLLIIFGSVFGLLIWGIATVISESTELLSGFNSYYEKAYSLLQEWINKFKFDNLGLANEFYEMLQNTAFSLLEKISKYFQNILTNILKTIYLIPNIVIYFIVFLLALYFICTDKIYMIDELEHHMPEKWMNIIGRKIKEISKVLGGYLKAEIILILISFVISVIGLYIMKFIGLKIEYPLLIALGIGFVDALPILGSGSVMVPWAVISGLSGEFNLGIAIVVLWIIMSIVRQFIEPKIVSRKYWDTPNIYNTCNVYRI